MNSTSVSAEGWYARAEPHPDASKFQPTVEKLLFIHRINTLCYDGFFTALFLPDIAVDSKGNILKVKPQDFAIMATLVEDVARLPTVEEPRSVWGVESDYSCRANDYLDVKTPEGGLKQTGVYAWDPRRTKLNFPEGGYEHLPPSLHELVGYSREAGRMEMRGVKPEGAALIRQIEQLVR